MNSVQSSLATTGAPVAALAGPAQRSGRIALCVETTLKYIYPQVTDLAEFLARSGHEVTVFSLYDPDAEAWSQDRGFAYVGIRRPGKLPDSLWPPYFCAEALRRLRRFSSIVTFTSPTLPLALAADRLLGMRAVHIALELHVPGDPRGQGYAFAQHCLRHARVRVFTTGRHRSRLLAKAYRLRTIPGEFLNAALGETVAPRHYQGPTIAEQVRRGCPIAQPTILLCNGGLDELNLLDRILDARAPVSSGLAIALIGPCSRSWRDRIAAARAETGNYFYLGELPGARYDVVRAAQGVDAGFALMRSGRGSPANDRLYTPNKLFDLLAAGAAPIVAGQSSLRFVEREQFGFCLRDVTVDGLRRFMLSLPQRRLELDVMKARARALFAAKYHFERTAREVVRALSGMPEAARSDASDGVCPQLDSAFYVPEAPPAVPT